MNFFAFYVCDKMRFWQGECFNKIFTAPFPHALEAFMCKLTRYLLSSTETQMNTLLLYTVVVTHSELIWEALTVFIIAIDVTFINTR